MGDELPLDDPGPAWDEDREDPAGSGKEELIGATLEGLRRAAEEVEQVAALAETLQRSLLGDRLPEIVGLRLAARYLAGSADAQVGGDWYEVIALRNGRAGLAIGDIVGHGIDAAARMAYLKSAVCAYALEGLRPAVVLERMNNFVRELEDDVMATLLYGIIDPEDGQLRIASAGHPPPLIVDAAGAARYADGQAGSPLGVVPFPRYEDTIVAVEPGSLVLLYTDGLVERPDASLDDGLEWLRGFAGGVPQQPNELCAALLESRFGAEPPRDDVALLATTLEPVPTAGVELTLRAEPESLASMRLSVGRWLREIGASDSEIYELLVACGEACSNAIAHAYPPGDASYAVEASLANGGVRLEIRDWGRWRAPRSGSQGRGLRLIEGLVDDLAIDRGEEGTVVAMERRLRAERDR